MSESTGAAGKVKVLIYSLFDRVAATRFGRLILIKTVEVFETSLGAGNHDDDGDRTGENRLAGALCIVLPHVTALDVGANNGSWTLELRARCLKSYVLAVEPGSQALGTIRSRVVSDPNVLVLPHALGNADAEAKLWGTDSNLQASLLPVVLKRTTRLDAASELPAETITVRTITSLIAEASLSQIPLKEKPVNVVKIDIEGLEMDVLEQITKWDGFAKIQAIQFELHMHAIAQGHMIADFQNLLGPEFSTYRLAARTLIPSEELSGALSNYYGFSNWVALRNEIAPTVVREYRHQSGRRLRPYEWRR